MPDNDLKEKLKRWFEPLPDKVLPVQAAAAVIAFKKQLQSEHYEQDLEASVEFAGLTLDAIVEQLYQLHCIDTKGEPDEKLIDKRFNMISGLPDIQHEQVLSIVLPEKLTYDMMVQGSELGEGLNEFAIKLAKISTPGKREFTKRATSLAAPKGDQYGMIVNCIRGAIYHGAQYPEDILTQMVDAQRELKLLLHKIGDSYSVRYGKKIVTPQDGPKTTQEMLTCCNAFLKSRDFMDMPVTSEGVSTGALSSSAAFAFFRDLSATQDDLPNGRIHDLIVKDVNTDTVRDIAQTHVLEDEHRLAGLMHYFLEHNVEKLTPQTYGQLRQSLLQIYNGLIIDMTREMEHYFPEEGATPEQIQEMLELFTSGNEHDYPKPSADDVVRDLELQVAAKGMNAPHSERLALQRFKEIRDELPAQMEEVVMLYYPESEELRRERQKIFKSKWIQEGVEGPKKRFIKELAHDHEDELLELGLFEDEIEYMRETGKVPEGSGLTVEHIVDRHIGGTNHSHNFILMSEELNALKDELKKIQQKLVPDFEEGCWMYSWVPKRSADGTYPKILNPYIAPEHLAPSGQADMDGSVDELGLS